MCLQPQAVYLIPEQTAQVARAILPEGNLCLRLYDELGTIYADPQFAGLFPRRGQPATSPTRLALVVVLQFLENLTDRQAADAVRLRIDWKYLLGLELTDRGFHYSVLSEFRDRLVAHDPAALLLDSLLDRLQDRHLYRPRGRARTDSTHILAAIHTLNRLELVGRTLQHALNALARTAPTWLRAWVPPAWFARYSRLLDEYRLPQGAPARQTLAEQIGADGLQLLTQLDQLETPALLRELPEVKLVQQVWAQQYTVTEGQIAWRATDAQPTSAQRITSPHDPDARYSTKRSVSWVGYKAHLTETCDDDLPHLIIHVETSPATEDDGTALPRIHADLATEERLPQTHLVDTTYASAELLVRSQTEYQVELVAPARPDVSWQAQDPQAFGLAAFTIDWGSQQATCPQGQVSRHWHEEKGPRGQPTVQVQFDKGVCEPCPVRARCTRRKTGPRELTLHPQAEQEALERARARQQTPEFKAAYAARAGVEGAISEAVGAHDMRRTRYIGQDKTHLQHVLTAVAMNLTRLFAWWEEEPRARTRTSPFAALAAA